MTDSSARRRVLVVSRTSWRSELVNLVHAAGWHALEADGFIHARFLLSMTVCDVLLLSDDLFGADFLDALRWLLELVDSPPVLVAELHEPFVPTAIRQGVLWVHPDSLARSASLMGAMLDQSHMLGRQRQNVALANANVREGEARVERLLRMLWEAAPIDGPSRWFTQRHMMERLDEEVSRCLRHNAPLTVVVGELAPPEGADMPRDQADRLSGWLAEEVARNTRRCDVAGHYGRNGFMMLMPQTTTEQAAGACQRLREILAHPPHIGPAPVHACLAITGLPGGDPTLPALLRRAEERLERARGFQEDGQ